MKSLFGLTALLLLACLVALLPVRGAVAGCGGGGCVSYPTGPVGPTQAAPVYTFGWKTFADDDDQVALIRYLDGRYFRQEGGYRFSTETYRPIGPTGEWRAPCTPPINPPVHPATVTVGLPGPKLCMCGGQGCHCRDGCKCKPAHCDDSGCYPKVQCSDGCKCAGDGKAEPEHKVNATDLPTGVDSDKICKGCRRINGRDVTAEEAAAALKLIDDSALLRLTVIGSAEDQAAVLKDLNSPELAKYMANATVQAYLPTEWAVRGWELSGKPDVYLTKPDGTLLGHATSYAGVSTLKSLFDPAPSPSPVPAPSPDQPSQNLPTWLWVLLSVAIVLLFKGRQ